MVGFGNAIYFIKMKIIKKKKIKGIVVAQKVGTPFRNLSFFFFNISLMMIETCFFTRNIIYAFIHCHLSNIP